MQASWAPRASADQPQQKKPRRAFRPTSSVPPHRPRFDLSVAKLIGFHTSSSTTSYSCYDGLGRVKKSSQQTGGTTYSFSYVYNLDGTLQSVTYPSTRKLAYQYDAAGRLTAIGENTVGATDYASAIRYKPHGGIKSLTLGNGLHESWAYNQRLQPTAIKLGTTSGGSDKLKLDFNYGTTNNNGNVRSQTITRPSLTALTQTYTYDGANRLKTAAESGAGAAWSRTYGYDVYGNRAVTANSGLPTSPLMPTATTNFSTSTNRLTLTGARYDNAGNLTATSLGDTLKYDAENRLKSYTYRNATTNYKYGPEGRRVQKATPTVTETYVYDAFGKLAAEYSTVAPTSGGTFYRTTDHLGSTRLVTKQDKSDADCYDYAPFGEEIPNTLGSRNSNACFAASFDGRQKFTGKERDDESDLDYFLARYYSGPMGRFLNPDAPFADQYPGNPQSWNLYGYTRNNPLSLVDPSGRCVMPADATGATSLDAICKDVATIEGISERGIDLIMRHEGLELEIYERSYRDPKTGKMVKDRRTVGYGHVVKDGDKIVGGKIDDTQAKQFLKQDIEIAEGIVSRTGRRTPAIATRI